MNWNLVPYYFKTQKLSKIKIISCFANGLEIRFNLHKFLIQKSMDSLHLHFMLNVIKKDQQSQFTNLTSVKDLEDLQNFIGINRNKIGNRTRVLFYLASTLRWNLLIPTLTSLFTRIQIISLHLEEVMIYTYVIALIHKMEVIVGIQTVIKAKILLL